MGKVRKAMPEAKKEKESKVKLSKFITKTHQDSKKKNRGNPYEYIGFFERLKRIDVKHGHASLSFQSHMFDHLTHDEFGRSVTEQAGEGLENDDLTTSNFIQLLRAEKFRNRTSDFTKVFNEVENLCFSYPLLILNKKKVVQKLLSFLGQPELKAVHGSILDLQVALIKDLRHEIYTEFLHDMLPKAIEVLEGDNLEVMDKVFQLLSFAFKYLLKQIKENIKSVFTVYIELLQHKNRFVRKFSAQSFSYVLRKVTIDEDFVKYLIEFLDEDSALANDRINGLAELFFEVISGHGKDLHSGGQSLLSQILACELVSSSQSCRQMIRILYLKLVNDIDVFKQGPIFEELVTHLGKSDDAQRLTLLFKILNLSVALKFGRRISQTAVVITSQALNNLIQNQSAKLKELPIETRAELAETLGLFFYFKHGNVMQIFQKSKLDFASAKTAYTSGIFALEQDDSSDCRVLRAFYSLVLQESDEITSKSFDDLNVDKVLHLKQSNQVTQFSKESHEIKARHLIKPLAQNTVKMLTKKLSSERVLGQIGLLVKLIQINGQAFTVDLPEKAVARIKAIKESAELTELQNYTLAKFIKITKQASILAPLFDSDRSEVKLSKPDIDFKSIVAQNTVLSVYGDSLDQKTLAEDVCLVMDFANKGCKHQIASHTSIVVSSNESLDIGNCFDLLTLRNVAPKQKLSASAEEDLFLTLNHNLSNNSVELRRATLKVLNELFETENYLVSEEANVDQIQMKKFYSGPCMILSKLVEYESIRLAFETDRTRETILRNVEVQVSTGLIPDIYLDTIFHLMIGSLWLKFTPGYAPAMSLIQKIFTMRPERFMGRFLRLLENIGHLTQFVNGDNEELEEFMETQINKQRTPSKGSIFEEIYFEDAVARQDYIQLKDFHFGLCKTLIPVIDQVLYHKEYKSTLFGIFDRFFQLEYQFLHQGRSKEVDRSLGMQAAMVQANKVDSEEFRAKRKTSYGKLCAWIELLSKASALKKLSPDHTQILIEHLMTLLDTADPHLQKNVLTCLIKCSKKTDSFKNKTAKLPKYAKLLEGLADDLKFRGVIPLINFGSAEGGNVNQEYMEQAENFEEKEEDKKEGKRTLKGAVPKLEKEDRLEVLPFIIKLLFSKLVKKKGAINKNNSLSDRRNIVYIFLSSLDPDTEFQLFFKELLEPLGLSDLVTDEKASVSDNEIRLRLVCVSFKQYTHFINTLEILFKQLGTLLMNQDFLGKLSRVLTLMLNLSKQFSGHLKETIEEATTAALTTTGAPKETEGDVLYRFVGKQSKTCLSKGLKIAKLLFKRFSYDVDFVTKFTDMLYRELIADQMSSLRLRYISEKSQLVEILTTAWSGHANCMKAYLTYPEVLPNLIAMLQSTKINPDNVTLILQMLKNIVQASLDDSDLTKTRILAEKVEMDESMASASDSDTDQEMGAQGTAVDAKEIAREILSSQVNTIGSNLHAFWSTNQAKLRQSIGSKTITPAVNSNKLAFAVQSQERAFQLQVLSTLTFIVSELSTYLKPEQASDAQSFLEMIVSMLSNKSILQANQNSGFVNSRQHRNEDLLVFGCQAINALLKTLLSTDETKSLVSETLLSKILLMMLSMESRKARESFTEGLEGVLSLTGRIKDEVLAVIKDMNKVKKGMADVTLDYEKVLGALEKTNDLVEQGLSLTEMTALTFNILTLVKSEEFSVRDYAAHQLAKFIDHIPEHVFRASEMWILTQLKLTQNELVIKSLLGTYRLFIELAHKSPIKGCIAGDLYPLLKKEKNEEDFFDCILSMQITQRQKALRKLANIQVDIEASSFRKAILPLVDYLIFDSKSHMQNKRNTVRYSKDQSAQTMEDALNIYVAYARRLSWPETFKLIRKFLYKIEKAQRNIQQYTAEKEDTEMEKTVTKSLCKVLEGLSLNEKISLPDAIEAIDKLAKEREKENPDRHRNEFSALLEELVGKVKEGEDEEEGSEDDDDEDNEKMLDGIKEDAETDIIQIDRQMMQEQQEKDLKRKVQMKLQRKVLPVLQRHLFETSKSKKVDKSQGQPPIRPFVAVAMAKIIRKLPMQFFRSQLQKLVNLIVVKGLRSPDLNCREKARRAMIKVLGEVSPRFLQIFFNEMTSNLNRGYQLHVHLYTVHYVLNYLTGLNGEKPDEALQPGQITSPMIFSMSDLLMRELFGDLMEERNLTDTQKKHIKESKAGKAIPIFEVFTQYIDFKKSFLDLIAPIVKILEQNPSFTQIHQCEELLNKISSHLLKNTTLTSDQLLVFLYSIIERGIGMTMKTKINDEKADRDYGAKVNTFVKKTQEQLMNDSHGIQVEWVKTHQLVSQKKTEEICGRVLANFGLQCLRKALKQKGLILQGNEHEQRTMASINVKQDLKDKLDPFVLLFLRAFKTFYNPIIVTTLHILVNVIHLGLPSFKTLMKKFLIRIFKLFNTAQSSDHEFLNTLFRCVTELIKTYSVYNDLSETQIKTLVLIIKTNVDSFQSQSHVFQCLRQIINRKFLCPDLYDLMETIEEMMVTNISKATRGTCANIFVQFLLEYPLEQQRLQQHINHMLKNLTYFDTDGRLQLLEVFQVIMEKFPVQLLDTYAELFFFTLFLRLVNDPIEKCRVKVALVLKKLISKASQSRSLLETVFKIGAQQQAGQTSEKQESLLAGKLQLIQLFAESGKLQATDISRTVDFTASIVAKHAKIAVKQAEIRTQATDEVDELEINPANADFLKGIDLGDSSEEELEQDGDAGDDEADLDEEAAKWSKAYLAISALENLMQSCDAKQVLTAYTETLGKDIVTLAWKHQNFWVKFACQRLLGHIFASCMQQKNFSVVFGEVFAQKENLLKLVYQMLSIFNSAMMSEEMANQLVKNLTFLQGQLLAKCDSAEDDTYIKVYKKASYIARKQMGEVTESTAIKLEAIVQFFTVSVQLFSTLEGNEGKIDNGHLRKCLEPILELICRTYSDDQMEQKVKDISTEMVDLFSGNLQKSFFISEFNRVQQAIQKSRMDRKMKQRLLVGTQEGQQIKAKKRLAKTIRKKEKKSEKVMQYKVDN